jgi:transcriptional regulator with XRE-family HTH domain
MQMCRSDGEQDRQLPTATKRTTQWEDDDHGAEPRSSQSDSGSHPVTAQMPPVAPLTQQAELADFLRRRRETLRPSDVGLHAGHRRRTPGLRRAEVAKLAHMSTDYYERLEQMRAPRPSASMLASLARALRLTVQERTYLYLLTGQNPPASIELTVSTDPGLSRVLSSLEPTTPAFVTDDLGECLLQNAMNRALFGDVAGSTFRDANLLWRWFTSPQWRSRLQSASAQEEEATGLSYVADLRATVTRRGHDPVSTELVADLRSASTEFDMMWDQHRVSTLHCSTKIVVDERVGRLDLDCTIVLSPDSTQRLLILNPLPGTETDQRLRHLLALIGD